MKNTWKSNASCAESVVFFCLLSLLFSHFTVSVGCCELPLPLPSLVGFKIIPYNHQISIPFGLCLMVVVLSFIFKSPVKVLL
jgi:hypothetical protein